MSRFSKHRLSPAVVIACLALFIVMGGTGYAASQSGNASNVAAAKKKHHKKKPKIATQKFVKQYVAKFFNGHIANASVKFAQTAGSANTATTALNAANLGGQPPTAYGQVVMRTGLAKLTAATSPGHSTPLGTFGPFTVTFTCTDNGGGSFTGDISVSSSEANSDAFANQLPTAGTPVSILGNTATTRSISDSNAPEFLAPSGKAYDGIMTVGTHNLGADCFANLLVFTG